VGAELTSRAMGRRLLAAYTVITRVEVWAVPFILLISGAVVLTGAGSPAMLLYAVPLLAAARTSRPVVQAALFGLTLTSYVGAVALGGSSVTPWRLVATGAALGAVALSAAYLVRGPATRRQNGEVVEPGRRAELLQAVAEAARSVSRLDTDQVLQAVVRAAGRLGFEAANLAVYDDAGLHYRVAHGIGLPASYTEARHSVDTGMPGLVRERRATVVVADSAAHPKAVSVLRDTGFRAVAGTPVWVQGSLDAALVAGTTRRRAITEEDVEALELLASLAGRALENARMFEDEHRAVERLGELDRLKGDFLSTVSHELRTPLTAIEGMGLTLEQQWEVLDEPVRRELLARLNANVISLHRIINTLLDFSRLEEGRMELRRETVAFRPLVEGIVGRLESMLADHHLTLSIPHDLRIKVDPALLERVIENLVSNAVKFTPAGTAVNVTAERLPGGVAEIAVTDRGPGIRPDDLRYLGDRFFRGGDVNTRRTRGTGLGLAVVREILRLHGSTLEVQSEVGRGSRFSFRLPAAPDPAARSSYPSSAT
jgi:signal transduction histidine kinase